MELSQRDKTTLNKWKKPLVIAAIVIGLVIAVLIYLASSAEAQTQNLAYNLSWTNGAVLPDGSNRPEVTLIQQRVQEPGSTVFTNWVEIGVVQFPTATFQDKIVGDPGGRSICYRVAHRNAAGTSPFTPEACVKTPIVTKVPNVPNNNQPVVIILGPFTVP